jgi:glycosyltransferase involved in cell wall biosynthesis
VEATADVTGRPTVMIGVPLYNGEAHVAEALESLLSQTYSDFKLVLVDDCSTDRTQEVVRPYAAEDPRIHFSRNDARLGLVGNWRRAFELAKDLEPDLDYFAWGSDHDMWHPRWLESLVADLQAYPEAVLAYPLVATVREGGQTRFRYDAAFDTADVDAPRQRVELTWHAGFGSRVYGLFRARALQRCGVFRRVYLPDRLLLVELSAHGRFREVPEVLWYRRLMEAPSSERERANDGSDRGASGGFGLPWFYVHGAALFWDLAIRGRARPGTTRRDGAAIAARYLSLARELRR